LAIFAETFLRRCITGKSLDRARAPEVGQLPLLGRAEHVGPHDREILAPGSETRRA
jgi:hypothetical protein